ncbi:MAG: ferritin family protein [Candidatus Zixiibacteriota bacterium]
MNIFEFAMKMESDGRTFYLEQSKNVDSPWLKKILVELADDELKHYNIFKAMKDGHTAEYKEAEQTKIIPTLKNVFEQLKAENKAFNFPPDSKKIWEEALEIEKKSEEFYREKADESDGKTQKHLLNRIADEEHKHWVTLQNVIRFLDRPNHWLADAEWSNLEDY